MENENENDVTIEYCEYEHCEYEHCDKRATNICDTCGALLCDDHVLIGNPVVVGGVNIPHTYCRKFACINADPICVVPHNTMTNKTTFATVDDVSRQINAYHSAFTSNGMCGDYNRNVLRRSWHTKRAQTRPLIV